MVSCWWGGGSLARRPRLLGYPPTDHLYQTITHDLILFLHLMCLIWQSLASSLYGLGLLWMKCVRQARVAKRYEATILTVDFFLMSLWDDKKNLYPWTFSSSMVSYSHTIFGTVTYRQNFFQTTKYGDLWERYIYHLDDIISTCWGIGLPLANFEDLVLVVASWWDVRQGRNMPPNTLLVSFCTSDIVADMFSILHR